MATSISSSKSNRSMSITFPLAWRNSILFSARIWTLLSLIGIFTVANVTGAPGAEGRKGPPCLQAVDDETRAGVKEVFTKCFQTTGLADMKKVFPQGKMTNTTLEDFSVDDKCYFECIYKEFGSTSDDGKIKTDAAQTIFKGNLTAETASKLNTVWNSCSEDCDKIMATKTDNKCMLFPLHMYCVKKRAWEGKVFENC